MESSENREQSTKANQETSESSDEQSLSRIETLKLLNDSIDRLEETIKGISESSSNDLPSSASIDTLVTTTQKLADAVATSPPPVPVAEETPAEKAKSEPPPTEVKSKTPSTLETSAVKPKEQQEQQKQPKQQEQQTVVNNQKKKNLGLIVIGATAIAIAIVAISWLWLPQRQATFSSNPESAGTEIITRNESSSEQPEQTAIETTEINSETNSNINIVAENLPAEAELANPELETSGDISIPQDLVSPGKAKNLKVATIEPELTFSPEQRLVAALQTKIAELTQDDVADSVNSIKVDLPNSSVLIEVKDDWYELNESGQNKLGNEILRRSRKLDFTKLEFKDSTGTLVARNPVVGDRIIILQSNKSN